ncbi:MAG TPA: hypothetical protein VG371_12570 [Solirubrobacteraceae bacterium]|nr:hypothetical protein [Solirubrobacteraceae bacterium]
MPFFALRRIAMFTGIIFVLGTAAAHAATEPAGFMPFAPDSIWNLPLRSDAPIAANSTGYDSYLTQSVRTAGSWVNTTNCGMPEYWAAPNTPTVSVTLNHPSYEDPALIRAWSAVPMPGGAQPASCSDQNFAVLQQQPNGAIKEWEFWKVSKSASGAWTAEWGGAMNNVLTDRGVASPLEWTDPSAPTYSARRSTYGWNVTASGISMLAGVITNSDLASGHINHALALAIPAAASGKWLWPAQRTDGYSTNPNVLPEGAHLRLNPSVNISSLHLTPLVAMIAEAAQRYGIVVRDQTSSSNVFYAEQPLPGQTNPVPALLAGQSMSSALAAFPWSQLDVLAAPTCTSWSGCSATPQAVINVDGNPAVGSTVTLDTTNSVLNYPRSQVEWDLTGSGTYITPGGTGVSATLPLTTAGSHSVGVRITTADGTVVTGTTTFVVSPQSSSAAAAVTTTASTAPAPQAPASQAPAPSSAAAPSPTARIATATIAAAPTSAAKAASASRTATQARTNQLPRVQTKAAAATSRRRKANRATAKRTSHRRRRTRRHVTHR